MRDWARGPSRFNTPATIAAICFDERNVSIRDRSLKQLGGVTAQLAIALTKRVEMPRNT